MIFGPKNNSTLSSRIFGYRVSTSLYGKPVAILLGGTQRLTANVICVFNWQSSPISSGGKFGGKASGKGGANQQYTYKMSAMASLCIGVVTAIRRIWEDKTLLVVSQQVETYTVPGGGGTFNPGGNRTWVADAGVFKNSAYSVVANDYGSPGSRTLTGSQQVAAVAAGSPAAGQYTVNPTTGAYTFAAADAGIVYQIVYTFIQGNPTAPGQTPVADIGLTLITGASGQAAWGGIAGQPVPQVGYSEVAYVAKLNWDLGTSGSLPNLSYETSVAIFGGGVLDALTTDCIYKALTDRNCANIPTGQIGSLTQVANYCLANSLFVSPLLDSQQTLADCMRELLMVANAEIFESEGLLKFGCYSEVTAVGNGATYSPATQPLFDLGLDDFIVQPGEPPVKFAVAPAMDVTNRMSIDWLDRENEYNSTVLQEEDFDSVQRYGGNTVSAITAHSITTQPVAAQVLNVQLKRAVYQLRTVEFTLGWRYSILEPMDVVTIPEQYPSNSRVAVRLLEIEEDDNGDLKCKGEVLIYGISAPTLYAKPSSGGFQPGFNADPGSIIAPLFYEAPPQLTQQIGFVLYIGLVGNSPEWGGCSVYVSDDAGVTYSYAGKVTARSNLGVLSASLATGTDPDTTHVVSVDLRTSLGVLQSFTAADADNFNSLALIGNELIAFEYATLTGSNQYNLASGGGTVYNRRGVYSTAITSHSSGARFLMLDGAPFQYDYQQVDVNTTKYFKFTSFNRAGQNEEDISTVTPYSFTILSGNAPSDFTALTLDSETYDTVNATLTGHAPLPAVLNGFVGGVLYWCLTSDYDHWQIAGDAPYNPGDTQWNWRFQYPIPENDEARTLRAIPYASSGAQGILNTGSTPITAQISVTVSANVPGPVTGQSFTQVDTDPLVTVVSFTSTAPSPLHDFDRVEVWIQDITGGVTDIRHDWDTVHWSGSGAVTGVIRLDKTAYVASVKVWLVSGNPAFTEDPIFSGGSESPHFTVTVPARSTTTAPLPGTIGAITGITVAYSANSDGNNHWGFTGASAASPSGGWAAAGVAAIRREMIRTSPSAGISALGNDLAIPSGSSPYLISQDPNSDRPWERPAVGTANEIWKLRLTPLNSADEPGTFTESATITVAMGGSASPPPLPSSITAANIDTITDPLSFYFDCVLNYGVGAAIQFVNKMIWDIIAYVGVTSTIELDSKGTATFDYFDFDASKGHWNASTGLFTFHLGPYPRGETIPQNFAIRVNQYSGTQVANPLGGLVGTAFTIQPPATSGGTSGILPTINVATCYTQVGTKKDIDGATTGIFQLQWTNPTNTEATEIIIVIRDLTSGGLGDTIVWIEDIPRKGYGVLRTEIVSYSLLTNNTQAIWFTYNAADIQITGTPPNAFLLPTADAPGMDLTRTNPAKRSNEFQTTGAIFSMKQMVIDKLIAGNLQVVMTITAGGSITVSGAAGYTIVISTTVGLTITNTATNSTANLNDGLLRVSGTGPNAGFSGAYGFLVCSISHSSGFTAQLTTGSLAAALTLLGAGSVVAVDLSTTGGTGKLRLPLANSFVSVNGQYRLNIGGVDKVAIDSNGTYRFINYSIGGGSMPGSYINRVAAVDVNNSFIGWISLS